MKWTLKVNENWQLHVPKRMRQKLGWQDLRELEMEIVGDEIILRKVTGPHVLDRPLGTLLKEALERSRQEPDQTL